MCVCVCTHMQSLTLCDPMDCSPPVSPVHGILQARILKWVAISFSRDLADPEIESTSLASPALADVFFTTVPPAKAPFKMYIFLLSGLFTPCDLIFSMKIFLLIFCWTFRALVSENLYLFVVRNFLVLFCYNLSSFFPVFLLVTLLSNFKKIFFLPFESYFWEINHSVFWEIFLYNFQSPNLLFYW